MTVGLTRDFFASFKQNLLSSMPKAELEQVMDETHWQYEKLCEEDDNLLRFRTYPFLRFCAVVVSLYRALLGMGIGKEQAQALAAGSGGRVGGRLVSDAAAAAAANAFFKKSGLDISWKASPDWTPSGSAQSAAHSGRA